MLNGHDKSTISLRMDTVDRQKLKRIAKRLGVRESDILRFAIKNLLLKLAPLAEPDAKGKEVLPPFLVLGKEMISFFSLDSERLDGVINVGDKSSSAVDPTDLALLAMSLIPDAYFEDRLREAAKRSHSKPLEQTPTTVEAYLFSKYMCTHGADTV